MTFQFPELQSLESTGPWPDALSSAFPYWVLSSQAVSHRMASNAWCGSCKASFGSTPRSLLPTPALSSGEAWVLLVGHGVGEGGLRLDTYLAPFSLPGSSTCLASLLGRGSGMSQTLGCSLIQLLGTSIVGGSHLAGGGRNRHFLDLTSSLALE